MLPQSGLAETARFYATDSGATLRPVDRRSPSPMIPPHASEQPESGAAARPEGGSASKGAASESNSTAAPRTDPGDAERIRRAQGGDESAFAELVRSYQDRAYRVARNLVGNDEDAADLAQEAFLRVFRSLARFDFQHEFGTWLYRIVTNLAIDHLRRRRPLSGNSGDDDEDSVAFEPVDESAPNPVDELERAETRVEVRECIEALAPHFRAVLQLRELEGLPCTQIAEIVGATHVTVRWRLHRGRKLSLEEWERRGRMSESGLSLDGDAELPSNDRPAGS